MNGHSRKCCPGLKCLKFGVPEWVNSICLNKGLSEIRGFKYYVTIRLLHVTMEPERDFKKSFILSTTQDQLQLCNSVHWQIGNWGYTDAIALSGASAHTMELAQQFWEHLRQPSLSQRVPGTVWESQHARDWPQQTQRR